VKPIYYYDGNYDFNGHSFTIPPGESVIIYVNGSFKFNYGSTITGGNLTIHARDGIDFTGEYIQADTKIYRQKPLPLRLRLIPAIP